MMMPTTLSPLRLRVLLGLMLVCASPLIAQDAQRVSEPQKPSEILQRADGARIVPDKFLRAWDPVTIFFDRDTGPAAGGPEDAPERFATLTPKAQGAWQWLGARALQFRPADAWKPLARIDVKADAAQARLVPLLSPPVSTDPAEDADPVTGLDRITLNFADPIAKAALSRLLSIEVRPSPGIGTDSAQKIDPRDIEIAALDRAKRGDAQSYVVRLREPIADGRVAILNLKLADADGLDDPLFSLRVRTQTPFVATEAACGRGFDDSKRDGVLRCKAYSGGSEASDEEATAPAFSTTVKRRISIAFSAVPAALDVLQMRDALRFTPPVDDLDVQTEGSKLKLSGRFLSDTLYTLSLAPGALADDRGRRLAESFSQRFAFAAEQPAIAWDAGQGIVERFGPQILPLRARGYDKADVRIHAVDPLARDFWPFPSSGIESDDAAAPPLPGNEPARWTSVEAADSDAIVARIKNLGSPAISQLIPLPVKRGSGDAKFGLDLKALLARIAGPEQPGTYLVGLRPTDGASRRWLRVQVTDLTLSAVEERSNVRFAITSLSSAKPIAEAAIKIEGVRDDKIIVLGQGVTDAQGFFTWVPKPVAETRIARVIVTKGLDTLVLDPDAAPSQYSAENWTKPDTTWLDAATDPETERAPSMRNLCHVFTERPIYRPEEPVHIKGIVRLWRDGTLNLTKNGGTLIVSGPSNAEWRIPVKIDAAGGFYHKFDAQTPATGDYSVRFEPDGAKPKKPADDADADAAKDSEDKADADAAPAENTAAASTEDTNICGQFPFKKEAYRLPTFEVVLNGPTTVSLDGTFNVDMLARYFAGGLVAERPVKWRAVQFPYTWTPPGREGFLFSTDARFSSDAKFKSSAVLDRDARTDAGGAARLTFDTRIEPTAQPRRYSIEATVTGDDDLQVRNVQNVIALPAFVLGIKIPRYVERPGTISPEILALDGKGDGLAGQEMTIRFIKRNWVSRLQASDFAQGSAKYVTQTIDDVLIERKITSTKDALTQSFDAKDAGVYVVQLEGYDKIGRRQQVSVDFFVGGQTPVTWAKAPAQSANVTTDKDAYAPGETATLVVQSPFQNARALAIVEQPNGQFRTDWVEIQNGFGRYPITIAPEQMPRLAVHFLVMRGRLPETPGAVANAPFDLGKPVTIAATKWITVTPVKNTVVAALDYPAKARPGQEVEVGLRVTDDLGKPIAGEATFWMVDQAVLSLAKERPLDILPSFIVDRPTIMAARDTRNMAFGIIPLEEIPGGDASIDEWGAENNVSVRKNFTPVLIYLPSVKIGADGIAKIKVKLPDTLTMFKLRAKVTSGSARFGVATGEMLVRQELVAQPALPRFLRSGDRFDLGVVARVVEGPGGFGKMAISANGLTLDSAADQRFEWTQNKPARIEVGARVAEPAPGAENLRIRFGLEREADRARDTVEIVLPVKPDSTPIRRYAIVDVPAGKSITIPAITDGVRAGSFQRNVTLAADPSLVRLVAGLSSLVEYPYGCTEQRIALASSTLALKSFTPLLMAAGLDKRIADDVRNTMRSIDQAVDSDGLVAFWPRGRGNVSLTAWSYGFLIAAEKAGEPIDKALAERLANVLKISLRSDYTRLIGGEELRERVAALAALAQGGKLDEGYAAELARRAELMPNDAMAEILFTVAKMPGADRGMVNALTESLWARVRTLSRNGTAVYAGLAGDDGDPLILPSETRSLAEILRATAIAAPADPRLGLLRDGLVGLADAQGWGSTNADASAIRALAASWQRPASAIPVALSGASAQRIVLDANNPVVRVQGNDPAALVLTNSGTANVVALVDTRFEPQEVGGKAPARSEGFAITREAFRVPGSNAPMERLVADADGIIRLKTGDVIEEMVEVTNPEDRTHVALTLPLAAGLEPLNPNLATAPAEAAPSMAPTFTPSWTSFGDDRVFLAYDRMPKGNHRFAYRMRALVPGDYTQPSATAETMYKRGVSGATAGRRIIVTR